MDVLFLSGLIRLTLSRVNGNCTKSSMLGRNCLLASRLHARLSKRFSRLLHGMFNFA
jgi:hypothetical protein